MTKIEKGAALLGRKAGLPASPDEAELDLVPNPHRGETYLVRFTAPEFTSLCPVTGQPDFAHLVIDYVPDEWLVESKSLEALSWQLPQSRRLSRGLHAAHRQATSWRAGCRAGCASAAIGIRAAACRSTCFGRPGRLPGGHCGSPTRACRPIAGGGEFWLLRTGGDDAPYFRGWSNRQALESAGAAGRHNFTSLREEISQRIVLLEEPCAARLDTVSSSSCCTGCLL